MRDLSNNNSISTTRQPVKAINKAVYGKARSEAIIVPHSPKLQRLEKKQKNSVNSKIKPFLKPWIAPKWVPKSVPNVPTQRVKEAVRNYQLF